MLGSANEVAYALAEHVAGSLDAELAVQVRYNADGRALNLDTSADYGFAFSVGHLTGDDILGESLHTYSKECKRYHNETFYHKQ